MSTNNPIDILDETLRILFLESGKSERADAEKEMAIILSNTHLIEMPEAMRVKLMDQLNTALVQVSLGQLISDAMNANKLEDNMLGEKTGLPIPVLIELKEDAIFTNNVPIVLLKKLLFALQIPFQTAEQAIRKTFETLQSRTGPTSFYNGIAPAYKKGGFTSRESYIRNMPKNSGKDLFQNEEALNRYLNRLNELMND